MMEFVAPRIDNGKPLVVAGLTAFQYSGLTPLSPVELCVYMDYPNLHGLFLPGRVHYLYQNHIDMTYCVHKHVHCEYLYIPSKERAIVETIKFGMDGINEGDFLEALDRYFNSPGLYNYKLLHDALKHFEVSSDQLNYWKCEAEAYMREF